MSIINKKQTILVCYQIHNHLQGLHIDYILSQITIKLS